VLVHTAGGGGVASTGTRVLVALAEALGLRVKAGPSVVPERGAEPLTLHATLAREPVRSSGGPVRVDGLIVAEPSALAQPDAVARVLEGGAIVVRADGVPEDVWRALPAPTQRAIQQAKVRLFALDAAAIAASASPEAGGRAGAAIAALVGAWLRVSALAERERLPEATVFERFGRRLAARGSAGASPSVDLVGALRAGGDRRRRPADGDGAARRAADSCRARAIPGDDRRREHRAVLGAGRLSLSHRPGRARRSVRGARRAARGHLVDP
jgi:Pyruvate/2-oxoacid:ferredoxin oxidoreductase gamma subunit